MLQAVDTSSDDPSYSVDIDDVDYAFGGGDPQDPDEDRGPLAATFFLSSSFSASPDSSFVTTPDRRSPQLAAGFRSRRSVSSAPATSSGPLNGVGTTHTTDSATNSTAAPSGMIHNLGTPSDRRSSGSIPIVASQAAPSASNPRRTPFRRRDSKTNMLPSSPSMLTPISSAALLAPLADFAGPEEKSPRSSVLSSVALSLAPPVPNWEYVTAGDFERNFFEATIPSDSEPSDAPLTGSTSGGGASNFFGSVVPPLEDLLVDIPDFAVCPVCSELFKNPVHWILCKHTFCKHCIDELVTYGHRECPLCRQPLANDVSPDELAPATETVAKMREIPARCGYAFVKVTVSSPPPTPLPSPSTSVASPAASPSTSLLYYNENSHTITPPTTQTLPYLALGPGVPSSPPTSHAHSSATPSSLSGSNLISSVEDLYRRLPFYWRVDPTGCPEDLSLEGIHSHMKTCSYTPVRCLYKGCQQVLRRFQIEEHQQNCPLRPVTCPHCAMLLNLASVADHDRTCPEMQIDCSNNCGLMVQRKNLATHLELCPLTRVPCTYVAFGCDFVGERRTLAAHLEKCDLAKVKGLIAALQTLNQRVLTQQSRIDHLEAVVEQQSAELKHLQKENNSLRRSTGAPSELAAHRGGGGWNSGLSHRAASTPSSGMRFGGDSDDDDAFQMFSL